MAMKAVKVTRKGQITLPVELRREFGIEEGDVLYLRKGEHGIEIVTPSTYAARTAGIFREYASRMPPLEPHEIRESAVRVWTEDAMGGLDAGERDES